MSPLHETDIFPKTGWMLNGILVHTRYAYIRAVHRGD